MICNIGNVSILVFVFLICLQVNNTHSLVDELLSCKQKFLSDLRKLDLNQCFNNSALQNVTSLLPLLKDIPPECINLNNIDKCVTGFVTNLITNLKQVTINFLLLNKCEMLLIYCFSLIQVTYLAI